MIVLVSLLVLLRGFPCFHDFSHGASLHPYSFIFRGSCINAAIIIIIRSYVRIIMRACVHA